MLAQLSLSFYNFDTIISQIYKENVFIYHISESCELQHQGIRRLGAILSAFKMLPRVLQSPGGKGALSSHSEGWEALCGVILTQLWGQKPCDLNTSPKASSLSIVSSWIKSFQHTHFGEHIQTTAALQILIFWIVAKFIPRIYQSAFSNLQVYVMVVTVVIYGNI